MMSPPTRAPPRRSRRVSPRSSTQGHGARAAHAHRRRRGDIMEVMMARPSSTPRRSSGATPGARDACQGVADDHLSGRRALSARRAGGRRGAAQAGRGGRLSGRADLLRPAGLQRGLRRRGARHGARVPAGFRRRASTSCRSPVRARPWSARGFRGCSPAGPRRRPPRRSPRAPSSSPSSWSTSSGWTSCRSRAAPRPPCTTPATPAGCSGVVEQPERLLQMVEGLEYVPLAHAELCCGFGGTFAVKMAADLDGHGRREGRPHARYRRRSASSGST